MAVEAVFKAVLYPPDLQHQFNLHPFLEIKKISKEHLVRDKANTRGFKTHIIKKQFHDI